MSISIKKLIVALIIVSLVQPPLGALAAPNYTITASAGAGGTISPLGVTTVANGGTQTYAIIPNMGYGIASLTVDGSTATASNRYDFLNVTDNHTIAVTFSESAMPPAGSTTLHMEKLAANPSTVSFGLPFAPGALRDVSTIRVSVAGSPVAINVKPLLYDYDGYGNVHGILSVLVQFSASAISGSEADAVVSWNQTGGLVPGVATQAYSSVSMTSPETAEEATRSIVFSNGTYSLVETSTETHTIFTGTEPEVMVTYPDGFLADSSVLGDVMSKTELEANASLAGVDFFSDELMNYGIGSIFDEGYRVHPGAVVDPEPGENYEGWLYDRCATYLLLYAHSNDQRFLRTAMRSCSFYAARIAPDGIFTGTVRLSSKYSHVKGLYAYYALTGDEAARTAATRIAEMWNADEEIVVHYANGHLRGVDKLWTERLLGTSLESLIYGYELTGNTVYLDTFRRMFETAYTHLTTTDQQTLTDITFSPFPPQNCWIHNAYQASEGDMDEPWCSGWMTELTIPPLLEYQRLTNDNRVDTMFVALTTALRDFGTSYFWGNPLEDSFLAPSTAYNSDEGSDPRIILPAYGASLNVGGSRIINVEWEDFEHSADATALVAMGIRGLERMGAFNAAGVAPFATKGESFVALLHEFLKSARWAFENHNRPNRDPRNWASGELAAGYAGGNAASQQEFIEGNMIGWPTHEASPQRKLSWWTNGEMLEFSAIAAAGVDLSTLKAGFVQPAGVTRTAVPATAVPSAVPGWTYSARAPQVLPESPPTPPSSPTGLAMSSATSSQANISWTASADNVGVAGYKVFRNGKQIGVTATNSYSDSGLGASTSYFYAVSAYDAHGNNSPPSALVIATTGAGSGSPVSYTLSYAAGSHGTLSGSASQTVSQGASGSAVTAVPDSSYRFVNWSDASTANPRTDTNIQASLSVTANFALLPSYTLAYAAGSHGALSGSTSQTVIQGGSGSAVTAVPASGYRFVNWSDSSTANPRTDTNIQANISVTASFELIPVVPSAPSSLGGGGGGSNTPSEPAAPTLPLPAVISGKYIPHNASSAAPDINTDKGIAAALSGGGMTWTKCQSGTVIKGTLPAVYYCGADGKRYVFPNEGVYKTWYADFSNVSVIADEVMAEIMIGGNVTYRPGMRMVKIQTDPKVYAVAQGGILRWVPDENTALGLYGANWNRMIDDVPDSFFVNYRVGDPISQ